MIQVCCKLCKGADFFEGFAGGKHPLGLSAKFANRVSVRKQVEAGTGAGQVMGGFVGGGNDNTILILEVCAQDGGVCIHVGYRGEKPGVNKTKSKSNEKREDYLQSLAAEVGSAHGLLIPCGW